jgi:anti-anti-sigma factor
MEIKQKTENGVTIVEINGRMDSVGSQGAQDAILSAIKTDGKLVLDMSGCDYVASSGLRVLIIAAKQSAKVNCRTVLCGVQPLIRDIIVMTGFENVLTSFPGRADAVKALE